MFLSVFIEITPIKINPIGWLGDRMNAGMKKDIDGIEKKLNEHIAQSYRNKILSFQNELLAGKQHTLEEFDEVLCACVNYEDFCKANNVQNDKVKLATDYIVRTYQKCQNERSFLRI